MQHARPGSLSMALLRRGPLSLSLSHFLALWIHFEGIVNIAGSTRVIGAYASNRYPLSLRQNHIHTITQISLVSCPSGATPPLGSMSGRGIMVTTPPPIRTLPSTLVQKADGSAKAILITRGGYN